MEVRTLVVDSSNLLKRSFHGARDAHTASFGHIGGLYGFFTSIRKLIKEHRINKIILFHDGEGGGIYRYRMDKNYKANRVSKEWHKRIEMTAAEIRREKEKEESILKQRVRVKAYAEELFIRQIEVDDIEADDLIAEYCITHSEKETIFLLSNDRDYLQLLYLDINILISTIPVPVTKFNYFMYHKHYYRNALLFKIICGDVSDNVKGISGMGEDTLLKHFPELIEREVTVNEIRKKAKLLNEERVASKKKPIKSLENLIEGKDRLLLNYDLVNLKKPILNDEARIALEELELPLSDVGRSSQNLLKMMNEDEFLTIYKGTFVQYIEPFYTVIMTEKQLLKEYLKKK